MITNRDDLKRMLAERGIKPTCQRAAILEAVMGKGGHPTIRALHERLIRDVPTLSKTTLYSTLELFARKGLVAPLFIDPAEVRYDGIPDPHHHFYCAACRRILDVDIACATGRAGRLHGHRVDEVHGYFKGVCSDCLASARAPRVPALKAHISKRRKAHA
jgi:Fe2+ or Zn2+ uptake regulation protein